MMNADGSGVRGLTKGVERADYTVWHPDGRKLAIVAERAGRCDLYLAQA
jgi:Tol biopolymer transport system component